MSLPRTLETSPGNRIAQLFTAIALCGFAVLSGRSPASIGPYTASQAAAGRAAYQANCASCHLPDMSGRNEAPQLAGANFMTGWRARTTSALFNLIRSTMPPGSRGALGDETYMDLVAFILQANGALAGGKPLTAAINSSIGSVATGQMPAALAQSLGQVLEDQAGGTQRATGPKGLSVTGVVKNYVPVTDEMLRNPDPADWLMIRRNYQAGATALSRKSQAKTSMSSAWHGSGQ